MHICALYHVGRDWGAGFGHRVCGGGDGKDDGAACEKAKAECVVEELRRGSTTAEAATAKRRAGTCPHRRRNSYLQRRLTADVHTNPPMFE